MDEASGLTYMQARYYDPVIGRFLSTDPIGYQDQLNLYAYVGNDPVNYVDPDGLYGRGSGFTDEEWEKFNAAQQKVGQDLQTAGMTLQITATVLANGGGDDSVTQGVVATFESVMGDGSGTAENIQSVANALYENASALLDDGSNGFTANVLTSAEMDAKYPLSAPHNDAAAGVPVGSQVMNLNRDHLLFNDGSSSSYVLAHEPNHNFGRRDERFGGVTAYSEGSRSQRRAYRKMPSEQRLKNADHIANLTH